MNRRSGMRSFIGWNYRGEARGTTGEAGAGIVGSFRPIMQDEIVLFPIIHNEIVPADRGAPRPSPLVPRPCYDPALRESGKSPMTMLEGLQTPARARSATTWLVLLALGVVAIHCALNGNYGYHRDELATIDDARRLAWGYVAYPPVTPAFGRLSLALFGTSLAGLRLFPALAFGLSMLLTGLMAREFGASRAAQLFAALVVAFAPLVLMGSSLYQYVAFDYLAWVALSWCVVRLLAGGDARWWLAIGAVIGLGLMTKYTIAVWVAALGIGMLATPARRWLADRHLWLGAALCLLLFLPNLLWQWQHDFVSLDFLEHIHERDVRIGRADGFVVDQLFVPANPLTVPLWLGGLWFLLFAGHGRFRALGLMFVAAFVLLLLLRGRSYYLAAAYPPLIAAGSAAGERALARLGGRARTVAAAACWIVLLAGGVAFATPFVPVAPLHSTLWNLSARVHDDFREQIGWPNIARTVSTLYASLPPDERGSTAALAANYGEAGALNLYRGTFTLPPVISPVNSYWFLGYGDPPPQQLIVLGYSPRRLAELFADCRVAVTVDNVDGVDNEESRDHRDIYLCRGPLAPWPKLWPTMRHYG